MKHYSCWSKHEEQEPHDVVADEVDVGNRLDRDDMFVHSSFGIDTINFDLKTLSEMFRDIEDPYHDKRDFEKFSRLVADFVSWVQTKANQLIICVGTLKLKESNGWPNKNFTKSSRVVEGLVARGERKSHKLTHEAKRILCPLGLEVRRIHTC